MKNKRLILIAGALVLLIALMAGIFIATRPETNAGGKAITVTVVYEDGSSKDFSYQTEEEYLGPVVLNEGLVVGEMGPYGLYIHAVDGVEAVYEVNGAFWSLYIGEESATTGADQVVIEDGGVYKLVYTLA